MWRGMWQGMKTSLTRTHTSLQTQYLLDMYFSDAPIALAEVAQLFIRIFESHTCTYTTEPCAIYRNKLKLNKKAPVDEHFKRCRPKLECVNRGNRYSGHFTVACSASHFEIYSCFVHNKWQPADGIKFNLPKAIKGSLTVGVTDLKNTIHNSQITYFPSQ
jgi:hypothetical protein